MQHKRYINNIADFSQVIKHYLPSQIWLDEFSEDYPYIEGKYADNKFYGAYVKQSFLVFDINSLTQLEKIFKPGMYIKL